MCVELLVRACDVEFETRGGGELCTHEVVVKGQVFFVNLGQEVRIMF